MSLDVNAQKYLGNQASKVPDLVVLQQGKEFIAFSSSQAFKSDSDPDMATLMNRLITQVNTNKGGHIHVKGYSNYNDTTNDYLIKTEMAFPTNGHFQLSGDGQFRTVFRVPSGSDNNIFRNTGVQSTDTNIFNYFHDFGLAGNQGSGGSVNTGFLLDSTTGGIYDSEFHRLYITKFAQDGVFADGQNQYNNVWSECSFTLNNRYGFYANSSVTGGTSTNTLINCKCSYGTGLAGVAINSINNSVINCEFDNNNQIGLALYSNACRVIGCKFSTNSKLTDNTYDDLLVNGTNHVITDSSFLGSVGANKSRYGINLSITTVKGCQIVNNNMTPQSGWSFSTAAVHVIAGTDGSNRIQFNTSYNPVGKITNMVDTTNVLNPFGTGATVAASTDYLIGLMDCYIKSTDSSNSNATLTIKDNLGNTVDTYTGAGFTGMRPVRLEYGFKCNWGAFTGTAPTVTFFAV